MFYGTLGLGWLIALINIAVAVVGAIYVYRDAEDKRDLFLDLHAVWWAGAVLVTSIFGMAFYWLLHYSTLAPRATEAEDAEEET